MKNWIVLSVLIVLIFAVGNNVFSQDYDFDMARMRTQIDELERKVEEIDRIEGMVDSLDRDLSRRINDLEKEQRDLRRDVDRIEREIRSIR